MEAKSLQIIILTTAHPPLPRPDQHRNQSIASPLSGLSRRLTTRDQKQICFGPESLIVCFPHQGGLLREPSALLKRQPARAWRHA